MPRSTASAEQAELMVPLPPMNKTLRALMFVTLNDVPRASVTGQS
jgi:hypothetical protein